MAGKTRSPTVSVDLARILMRYASDNGLDGDKLRREIGLNPELLQMQGARIPAALFDALWHTAAKASGDALFGLHLGCAMKSYAGGHLLYAVLLNSPTVGAALAKFCRYHAILSDVVQPRLVGRAEKFGLFLEKRLPGMDLDLGQEAFILGLFASILKSLTDGRDPIEEVWFSSAPPEEVVAYQRVFGSRIKYQSRESALFIPGHIIDQPVFLANPVLLEGIESVAAAMLEQHSSKNSVKNRTAQIISRMLITGDKPSIQAVAVVLGMSSRRLQQRLKSEQSGYREILDNVRKETAMRLLKDEANTIAEIAFLLGFAEQSGFTHAFQIWSGTTPGKYRRNHSAHQDDGI